MTNEMLLWGRGGEDMAVAAGFEEASLRSDWRGDRAGRGGRAATTTSKA